MQEAGVRLDRINLIPRQHSHAELLAQQATVIEELDASATAWAHVSPDSLADGVTVGLALSEESRELTEVRTFLVGQAVSVDLVPTQPTAYSAHSDTLTDPDMTISLSDGTVTRTVGKVTRVMRDDNNDGVGECTTVTGGDSGGPVLYEPGIGATSAKGYGIVTGGIGSPSCAVSSGTQRYPKYVFVTRMQGLKSYDSGAAIGGFS